MLTPSQPADGRGVGHAAFLAADDASDRHRSIGIGDHEHSRADLSRLPVEAQQRLAFARLAHVKLLARELAGVEDVGRLGVLEHHVGGGVDHVANGAHPGRAQAALDPVGARCDLHARDWNRDEPAAQVGHLDRDVDELGRRRLHALDVRRHEIGLEVASGRRAELTRDAYVSQTVGPVGRDLGLEDRVGRDVLRQRLTRFTAVEQHDLRLAILAEQQLVSGTQHPLAQLARDLRVADERAAWHTGTGKRNRHQRAGHSVRSAGDDLDHLAGADVDLVDPQRLVRARVVLLLEHAPDDDR